MRVPWGLFMSWQCGHTRIEAREKRLGIDAPRDADRRLAARGHLARLEPAVDDDRESVSTAAGEIETASTTIGQKRSFWLAINLELRRAHH